MSDKRQSGYRYAPADEQEAVVLQRERPILDLDGVKDIDGARRVCELREKQGMVALPQSKKMISCRSFSERRSEFFHSEKGRLFCVKLLTNDNSGDMLLS